MPRRDRMKATRRCGRKPKPGALQKEEDMTIQQMKDWINNASYRDLLYKWRFARAGDPFFTIPEVSDLYEKRMAEFREKNSAECIRASKAIG